MFEGEAARHARSRLEQIFAQDFESAAAWVLKDPRHCRLLPLWKPLFESGRADFHFVLVLRHPLAVAASLSARDRMPVEQSLLLWLRHTLESEFCTRQYRRSWVLFDSVVRDPQKTLERTCEHLELTRLLRTLAPASQNDALLDQGLVHHKVDDAPLDAHGVPWLAQTWKMMQSLAATDELTVRGRLDKIRAELECYDRFLGAPLEGFVSKRFAATQQVAERSQQLVYLLNQEKGKLQANIDHLTQETQRLAADYRLLEARPADTQERDELRQRCEAANEFLAKSREQLDAERLHTVKDRGELRQRYDAANQLLAQSREQTIQLDAERLHAVKDRDELRQRHDAANELLAQSRERVAELDAERLRAVKDRDELRQRCEEANELLAKSHEQIAQLDTERLHMVKDRDELRQRCAAANELLIESREQIAQLDTERLEAIKSRDDVRLRFDTANKIVAKSLDFIGQLDTERTRLIAVADRIGDERRREAATLQELIASLRVDVASRDRCLSDLSAYYENSRSWRYTAALRGTKKKVAALFGRRH